MKKAFLVLILFFIVSTSSTIAQEYRDKIIKTNNDTIVCEISLINQDNVFYYSKKNGAHNMSVSLKEISSIQLDPASKPEIITENYKINISVVKDTNLYSSSGNHERNNDKSPIGIYISGGFGDGGVENVDGLALDFSGSFAYKSHMLTYSVMGCSQLYFAGAPDGSDLMGTWYRGILFGEAYRGKNIMLSLSGGFGYTKQNYDHYIGLNSFSGYYVHHDYNGLSYPIEVNIFFLAHNVIGAGFHWSVNIIPGYSSSAFTISIVLGAWNIKR